MLDIPAEPVTPVEQVKPVTPVEPVKPIAPSKKIRKPTIKKGEPHIEVIFPTYKEEKEELDIYGWDIEYVPLTLFDLNQTTYFRDAKKNKLYTRVNEKVGKYVGKYDTLTESIMELPDSDAE